MIAIPWYSLRLLFTCSLFLLEALQYRVTGKRYMSKVVTLLGPTYIKLGQTLSTRPDIVGQPIADSLSQLQDKLPPFAFRHVQKIIKKDLGSPINQLFENFDKKPIAAASIAQVHHAILADKREVAVKILRPGIKRRFRGDIRFFLFSARILEIISKEARRLRLVETVELFAHTVDIELDLRLEAAAASELKENLQDNATIYIPEILWNFTSQKLLTSEWIKGVSIYDKNALAKLKLDQKTLSKELALGFFHQAYRDGFFHADLHPGNILVDKQGRIIFVDFGIMGRLDKQTRCYVAQIILGFVRRDYAYVADIHFDAGYVPAHHNRAEFAQAMRSIGEPIIGQPVNQISIAKLLQQLFKITADFDMQTQPQLLLLQKTMVLVEGMGMMLYKEVNMWELIAPWIEEWGREELGVKAQMHRYGEEVATHFSALSSLLVEGREFVAVMRKHQQKKSQSSRYLFGLVSGIAATASMLLLYLTLIEAG